MKQRASVTTCDYSECDAMYLGDERPDLWLSVVVKSNDIEGKSMLTFCSYQDLGQWAAEMMEARAEATPDE